MQSTVHSAIWVLTLVATAAVTTAQPLPSLDEEWPSGTRRFTLAQASGTTRASSTAPPDEDNPAELAKKLQNPVADLITQGGRSRPEVLVVLPDSAA